MSVKTISRSKGQSAVASAAYRSGQRLADARTGEVHDYRRKTGVVHAEVITPATCLQRPMRAEIWNDAEAAEARKNSTVAREIELALPHELGAGQRSALARDFARELADRHGVVVDVCVHEPNRRGQKQNHHAHLLMTTRRIDNTGKLGPKAREWDDRKTGPGLVREWRARWADLCNKHLACAGLDARVDHRSYADQGVELLPTTHLGPAATAMVRRGEATDRGEENRRRQAINREINRLTAELAQLDAALATLASAADSVGPSGDDDGDLCPDPVAYVLEQDAAHYLEQLRGSSDIEPPEDVWAPEPEPEPEEDPEAAELAQLVEFAASFAARARADKSSAAEIHRQMEMLTRRRAVALDRLAALEDEFLGRVRHRGELRELRATVADLDASIDAAQAKATAAADSAAGNAQWAAMYREFAADAAKQIEARQEETPADETTKATGLDDDDDEGFRPR